MIYSTFIPIEVTFYMEVVMNKFVHIVVMFYVSASSVMAETINMATVDWQPFQGTDLHKQGFTVEITKQALARKGLVLNLSFVPWARAEKDVKSGRYHALFNQWKNKKNENDFYFSTEVFAAGDGHFIGLRNSELTVNKLEDLTGKTVGFVRAYPVSDELEVLISTGVIKKYEVSNVVQLIKLLKLGRIDVALENKLVIQHNVKTYLPQDTHSLKVIGKDLIDGSLYIGWSKQVSGTRALRNEFDAAIREMREDGTIDKIKQEFGMM
jgi:polar amino acid transport system substrate-binding protein